MTDINKNTEVKTELHDLSTALDKVDTKNNPNTEIKDKVDALKKKAQEKVTQLNTMVVDILKGKEPENQESTAKTIQEKVNQEFKFDEHMGKIDLLMEQKDDAKKKLANDTITGLENEFKRIENYKITLNKPAATTQTQKNEKPSLEEIDNKREEKMKGYDEAAFKILEETKLDTLRKAPARNSVIKALYESVDLEKITDKAAKDNFTTIYDAVREKATKAWLDPAKRLNFFRAYNALPTEAKGATVPKDDEIVAAEKLWKLRVKNESPEKTEMKEMTAAEMKEKPVAPVIPADSQSKTGDVQSPTAPAASKDKEGVTADKKENTPAALDWAKDKEKIVNDAVKDGLSALSIKKTVDFSKGEQFDFTSNAKKYSLTQSTFTQDTLKTNFTMSASSVLTFGTFKNLPIKQLQYKDDSEVLLYVDASSVGGSTNQEASLSADKYKDFITSAIGIAHDDSSVKKEIPDEQKGAKIKISFVKG